MLTPVLALIIWTLILWVWMYATRLPAMKKAKIDPQLFKASGQPSALPDNVRVVADNYNHLHEQPVIFYALAFYTHLAGNVDGLTIGLAWAYVMLRVLHSFIQIVVQHVATRFVVFALASLMLVVLALLNVAALF